MSRTLNNIYLLLFSTDKGDRKEFVHVPCPSKLEKIYNKATTVQCIDMINITLP